MCVAAQSVSQGRVKATEPRIYRFRGGWAVIGEGLATFGASKEEALRQFRYHAPAAPTPVEEVEEPVLAPKRHDEIIAPK
jgi:hypothetical protein